MIFDILAIHHPPLPPVGCVNKQRRLSPITIIYIPTLYNRTNENLEKTDERWCRR